MPWCVGCEFFNDKSAKGYVIDDMEWYGVCSIHASSLVETHFSCDSYKIKYGGEKNV